MIEHGVQRIVVAPHIEQAHGFVVLVELGEGERLEMLVHAAVAAGHSDHGVGFAQQQGAPFRHGFDDLNISALRRGDRVRGC